MSGKIFIQTHGCQMNEYDSAKMLDVLKDSDGMELTDNPDEADVLLLNTCSIRDKAEQKVYSLLGQLAPLKKKNAQLKIGVIGCVAQQEGDNICKRAPYVDMIVGTQQIYRIPSMLDRLTGGQTTREIATDLEGSFIIPGLTGALTVMTPQNSTPSSIISLIPPIQEKATRGSPNTFASKKTFGKPSLCEVCTNKAASFM